ncbi:hypothetical protein B0J12DRAFT_698440 [Macrophomina phaseolina]|uniref:Uncharacterized protein n=1 Tax=Macrophomina phaseolina TaxID=35725 RepID=A0ABQ8GEK0_9PEZI|nr:hypothetical protein B0J12DRAFT_698440 [Macrophomina phaseolina]
MKPLRRHPATGLWCMQERRGKGCRTSHLTRRLKGQSASRSGAGPLLANGLNCRAQLGSTGAAKRNQPGAAATKISASRLSHPEHRLVATRAIADRTALRGYRASAATASEACPAVVVGKAVDVCMRAWLTSDRAPDAKESELQHSQRVRQAPWYITSTPHDGTTPSSSRRALNCLPLPAVCAPRPPAQFASRRHGFLRRSSSSNAFSIHRSPPAPALAITAPLQPCSARPTLALHPVPASLPATPRPACCPRYSRRGSRRAADLPTRLWFGCEPRAENTSSTPPPWLSALLMTEPTRMFSPMLHLRSS